VGIQYYSTFCMNILFCALHWGTSLKHHKIILFIVFYNTRISNLFLGFRYCELQNIYKRIPNRARISFIVSSFIDSVAGLVPSMVRSSSGIKQVYNCEPNDVGPV